MTVRKLITKTAAVILLFFSVEADAQISQEEHLSHHPELAAQATNQPGTNNQPVAGQGAVPGASMGGMGDMMKMHGVPKKEIYPSLMTMPSLTPEKEHELRSDAEKRIREGVSMLSQGIDKLQSAEASTNISQMDEASNLLEEAVNRLKSGTSALKVLSDTSQPKEVALSWFRKEMDLTSKPSHELKTLVGMSVFHFLVMVILTVFSISVLVMYFIKMRRAALLLRRLVSPGGGSEGGLPPASGIPPSSSPPSGGTGTQAKGNENLFAWTGDLVVNEIITETPQIKTFRLRNPLGGKLPFTFIPGQFVTLAVNVKDKIVKRSYTIASSPTNTEFCDLTIKKESGGKVSPILHDTIRVGDRLKVSGPSGLFTFTGSEANSIVLIGAGVGVTPLMSVIRYLLVRKWQGQIRLFFSFRNLEDYLFSKELEELSRINPNFRFYSSATGKDLQKWTGLKGRFTKEMISAGLSDSKVERAHICGPVPFMDQMKNMLLELGVAKDSIKLEAFGPEKAEVQKFVVPAETIVTTTRTVTFTKSGKKGFIPPHLSVLEAAESLGVEIENSCRVGTCGICKVKVLSGDVTMGVEDGLTEEDKALGYVLACQAKSTNDLVIEA